MPLAATNPRGQPRGLIGFIYQLNIPQAATNPRGQIAALFV